MCQRSGGKQIFLWRYLTRLPDSIWCHLVLSQRVECADQFEERQFR
jgi:hypothetical protein